MTAWALLRRMSTPHCSRWVPHTLSRNTTSRCTPSHTTPYHTTLRHNTWRYTTLHYTTLHDIANYSVPLTVLHAALCLNLSLWFTRTLRRLRTFLASVIRRFSSVFSFSTLFYIERNIWSSLLNLNSFFLDTILHHTHYPSPHSLYTPSVLF